MSDEVKLKQELGSWQIFFITISAVIGSGIFAEDGEALEVSGPGGTLLSLFIMGAIAIATMEGLSEMVQLFPAPNAIVEYIGAFVDADLGWIMGIAYWYTYASIFATQIITAANFSTYWNLSQVWQTLGFYVLAPIAILAINFVGIW
ncbi:hypothetical protein MMC18_009678, partial [Xylographa bjoerkii]|nr:hypothetical protein [Xylographa bjoerkii]